jgi:hypothetical protein
MDEQMLVYSQKSSLSFKYIVTSTEVSQNVNVIVVGVLARLMIVVPVFIKCWSQVRAVCLCLTDMFCVSGEKVTKS